MGQQYQDMPVGMRFRPSDFEMAYYFLLNKVLGVLMEDVPEECHDIFSRHPRDLPGYIGEGHWYYYCRKLKNEFTTSHNLWTPTGEETNVFDPKKKNGKVVGIKRSFAFIENEEYDNNGFSDEEEPPKYNWFMDEISLPLTVLYTDWVLCHIFGKKIKTKIVNLHTIESESEEDVDDLEEEKEEVSVDKPAETLDIVRGKNETVLPPSPASP